MATVASTLDVVLEFVDPSDALRLLETTPQVCGQNKELLLKAVSYSHCLHLVSLELRYEKDVVRAAARQNYDECKFASEELKDDGDFMKGFVRSMRSTGQNILPPVSLRLRNDGGLVLAAVQAHGSALEHSSEELKNQFLRLSRVTDVL